MSLTFLSQAAEAAPTEPTVPEQPVDALQLGQTTLERLRGYMEDPNLLKDDVLEFGLTWGPKVLAAVVVFMLGMWAARVVRNIVRRAMVKARFEEMLANFLSNIAHIALVVFVVIMAMGTLGIPTTGFAAIIAAAGFAIAFALQGSLGNFAAGVMIMIFKPFKPGDYVEGGGQAGSIVDVGIFATVMKTPDNRKIIIPNGELTASSLTNYSANPTRRVDMVFGIGYGDDIDKARNIIKRVLSEDTRVLKDPAPQVAVAELADSSVNFVCRPWVNAADYWDVKFEVTEKVKKAFDAEGVSIPFPQRDVHLHQA